MGWPVPHFGAWTKAMGLGSAWGQHFCCAADGIVLKTQELWLPVLTLPEMVVPEAS